MSSGNRGATALLSLVLSCGVSVATAYADGLSAVADGVRDPNDPFSWTAQSTALASISADREQSQFDARPLDENGEPIDHPCKHFLRTMEAREAAAKLREEDGAAARFYSMAFDETDVLHYDLDLEVLFDTTELVGSNRMQVRSLRDGLTEFWFRLADTFTSVDATLNDTTPATLVRLSPTTCVVTLDRPYNAGEEFSVTIDYEGMPRYHNSLGSIIITNNYAGVGQYAATLSEPYFAYGWWPCKDGDRGAEGDNRDKATIAFSITAPDNLRSLGPGILENEIDLGDGRKRYEWRTRHKLPAYLNFFATTDYVTNTLWYEYDGGSMPVEFNSFNDGGAPWSNEGLLETLALFEEHFGPYPFRDEKYGIYEFHYGGMEHPTSSGQSSPGGTTATHELAHQWWGDDVTCATWHEAWLNEGFATYFETTSNLTDVTPEEPQKLGRARRKVFVDDTTSATDVLHYHIYFGGAAFLEDLRAVVGHTRFWRILHAYRAKFSGSAASTEDFAQVCNEVSGQDLTWLFLQRVYGQRAPVINCGWRQVDVDGASYLQMDVQELPEPNRPEIDLPLGTRVRQGNGVRPVFFYWHREPLEHAVFPLVNAPVQVDCDWYEYLTDAPRNRDYIPGPPVVLKTDPAIGSFHDANDPVDAIEITFIDPVEVDPNDFTIEREDGAPLAAQPTLVWLAERQTARLEFATPLPLGDYIVTAHDSIEFNGFALDGEIAGGVFPSALPSGDTQPGGDAVFRFTIGPAPVCEADINDDGIVDSTDLSLLLLNYGVISGATRADGDLTGDGAVDGTDLSELLTVFAAACD